VNAALMRCGDMGHTLIYVSWVVCMYVCMLMCDCMKSVYSQVHMCVVHNCTAAEPCCCFCAAGIQQCTS
jgi:hypothetical protein